MNRRWLLLLTFLTIGFYQSFGQIVWQENFTGVANNATSDAGATAWSVITPPTGNDPDKTFQKKDNPPYGFQGESFVIRNTGAESVWRSQDIDISLYGIAILDVTVTNILTGNNDYVRIYYQVDNGSGFGSETLLSEVIGAPLEQTVPGSAIITGKKVRLIIRANENSWDGVIIFFPIYSYFVVDDITVTGVETLYSRKITGNWNDNSANSSWSPYPLSDPLDPLSGGTSCNCAPDQNKRVVIQNGHTINVNANAQATITEVEQGGTLRWSANSLSLSLYRGGYLINNGTISGNGHADSRIIFPQSFAYTVTNNNVANNAFTIGDINLTAAASVTFAGAGVIRLTDDLLFSADIGGVTNNTRLDIDSDIVVSSQNEDGNILTNSSGATLDVNAINPAGSIFTINNYGTINQVGAFSNAGSGDYFNLNNANWNYSAAAVPPNELDCTALNNTFNYSGAAQSVRAGTYHHLTFSGSSTKTTQGNIVANGNISIAGSASFNVDAGDDNVSVAGNWTVTSNNGDPFVPGTTSEIVTFNGSTDQTFSKAGGETFNRVVVNKSGGSLYLSNPLSVSNGTGTDLSLTSGVIRNTSSSLLTISDGATIGGGSDNSYVAGPVKKIGNDNFIFPTGSNARYAPIGISNFTGGAGTAEFTAQYIDSKYTNVSTNSSLSHVSWAEYWTLDRNASTRNVAVTLYWRSTFSDITNLSDLRVARFNGTNWISEGSAATAGTTTSGNIRSNVVTIFSQFTFGSAGGINPLPIQLLEFSAAANNNQVDLTWQTAQEINNDFFTIEKSSDGESFSEVGKKPGKGTSYEVNNYSLIDYNPFEGRSYYRLKQTDFDGTYTYSEVKSVVYNGPESMVLSCFPNPSNGAEVTFELKGVKTSGVIPVKIVSQQGTLVYEFNFDSSRPGVLRRSIQLREKLSPGLYIVQAGQTSQLTQKLVIN